MSFDIDKDLIDVANDFSSTLVDEDLIIDIELSKIMPSPFNPIGLYNDEKEAELINSIISTGVRTPILVRPLEDGKYELIDGHNRVNCAKKAGLFAIPAFVKNYNDEDARFINLDAILQQRGFDDLKPSDRAKVIHDLTEDLKKENLSTDLQQGLQNIKSEIINERTKRRYQRLYRCCDEIKALVDEEKMAMGIAIEFADLTPDLQKSVIEISEANKVKIDAKKAKIIKEKNQKKELTEDVILEILVGNKRSKKTTDYSLKIPQEIKDIYFEGKSKKEIQNIVIKALENYFKNEA